MLKIAITGNIASGKSTVEEVINEHGFKVFDTDKIAHTILENSELIKKHFSTFIFDGKIDRKKLGEFVFSNSKELHILESIIHPEVRNVILKIFEENQDEQAVFISVPQLFETKMDTLFDKIILISADEKIRLRRVMTRNNLTEKDALNRINAQISEEIKKEKCDFILENNSTKEDLVTKTKELISKLTA